MTIAGIHHITAIASDPQRNLDFYTGLLGLRLVKLTINFDDPSTYHFYFGDRAGSPGTILTFFPWPGVPRGRVGNRQVSAITFSAPAGSLPFWMKRLEGYAPQDLGRRFDQQVIRFNDPDGLVLEMIETSQNSSPSAWTVTGVPVECAILGFHSATLSEEGYERTAALLQDVMGFGLVATEGNRFRYAATTMGPGALVDVVCAPDIRSGSLGAGTVHHIAWRTPNDAEQAHWREQLVSRSYNVSPVMDRTYFHSIYFREPGGILFEIATDPPGFTVDESLQDLGTRLMLPPWLESTRRGVEQAVAPLTLPSVGR